MPDSSSGKGFVFICDGSNHIERIIQNDYEIEGECSLGAPLEAIFDHACLEKVLLFLSQAHSNGSAFDWELILPVKNGLVAVHCAAALMQDQLLVVGAGSRDSAIEVIEEMLKINNQQTNHLRILMKELQKASSLLNERDQSVYDELTYLNNRLSAMQRELVKKNHELARLNQQKNYFLGMAAHDLRSPLGTIVSCSEFLLDRNREHSFEEDLELCGVIKKSGEFMLGLINDLLDISKIESGHLQLNIGPLDLSDVISRCLAFNQASARKKQIRIQEQYAGTLPDTVFWDLSKMEQVLNNLLGNAVKFSHPGSTIIIRLSSSDNKVVIQVEDNGEGLPAEILDRLFIPFSNSCRLGTRGEKGAGLGLAIARHIIEGHKGEIRAENVSEGGARFIITLPVGGD